MGYTIDREIATDDFQSVVMRTRRALAQSGFGVLTEIDVKATMKKKLDADIDDYLILGACNPALALKALKIEPKVGAMLPCNVILRRTGPERVEVSAVDPVASMTAIANDVLERTAAEVRSLLTTAVAAI